MPKTRLSSKSTCFDVVDDVKQKLASDGKEFDAEDNIPKSIIITGANSGIGLHTARALASLGCNVILACRSKERGEAAAAKINAEFSAELARFMELDLADLDSVRSFVDEFRREKVPLDCLINNAGITNMSLHDQDPETKQGIEAFFGINHLGHFLLTMLLLDDLKSHGRPARIVTVSSMMHSWHDYHVNPAEPKSPADFEHYGWNEKLFKYPEMVSYCNSKLCNIWFTKALQRRLSDTNVSCFVLHPGTVMTETNLNHKTFGFLIRLIGKSEEQGAATSVLCAIHPDAQAHRGKYFASVAPANKQCAEIVFKELHDEEQGAATSVFCAVHPDAQAHRGEYFSGVAPADKQCAKIVFDEELQEKMWNVSMRMSGLVDDASDGNAESAAGKEEEKSMAEKDEVSGDEQK